MCPQAGWSPPAGLARQPENRLQGSALSRPVRLGLGLRGCGLLLLFSGREALFPLAFTGFALLALSFLLASPSALFMLLTLDLLSGSLRDAGVNAFFQSSAWFAAMFLAGLLPPMLFFLGSLLPKKRLTTAKNVIK